MGKIYLPPASIKVPELNFKDFGKYKKSCDKFMDDLRDFCIKRNPDEHVGEVIKFPVADGYALYMVASLKPIELIHIPLMDAYEFEYVHKLSKKDILEKIKNQKALEKLFPSRG
jgi:hypothetical protein